MPIDDLYNEFIEETKNVEICFSTQEAGRATLGQATTFNKETLNTELNSLLTNREEQEQSR